MGLQGLQGIYSTGYLWKVRGSFVFFEGGFEFIIYWVSWLSREVLWSAPSHAFLRALAVIERPARHLCDVLGWFGDGGAGRRRRGRRRRGGRSFLHHGDVVDRSFPSKATRIVRVFLFVCFFFVKERKMAYCSPVRVVAEFAQPGFRRQFVG